MTILSTSTYFALVCVCWAAWKWLVRSRLHRGPLDNLPGPRSLSFLTGNSSQIFHRMSWTFQDHLSAAYGKVFRFWGPFGAKGIFVSDPTALRHIIMKQSDVFEYGPMAASLNHFIFGVCFVSVLNDHHQKLRKMMLPAFSPRNVREKLPVFYNVACRLRDAIAADLNGPAAEKDMLDWSSRVFTEIVGESSFDYPFNVLSRATENRFGEAIAELVPAVMGAPFWVFMSRYHAYLGPRWVKSFLAKLVPDPAFQNLKRISTTMQEEAFKIVKYRKERVRLEDGQMEDIEGKNVLDILMHANTSLSAPEKLSDEELQGQVCMMTLAATDTTTNNLARTLHLLACHSGVQDKLHEELDSLWMDDDVDYAELINLPYLDAVIKETLRLHPVGGIILREAQADGRLPLSTPIEGRDGNLVRDVLVPRGTPVFLGVRACNSDRTIWGDDAAEWKPDRWLSPLPETVKQAHIPGVYPDLVSFSGGQRGCMGFQFAILETKVVLAVLLRAFRFSPGSQEITWNFGNITYPTVGKDLSHPAMPLKVELRQRN
ncbi:hypothetical protein NM688_g186 [Phlebia brevispora]|uniref:Uncharacterized protein n=1 Tax=Phlebia brevispora TaxID=194682 RepID=A0ACC1TF69_9APHY|nr:hypothetical protein NM688_g186 [Phlebia brevispora]